MTGDAVHLAFSIDAWTANADGTAVVDGDKRKVNVPRPS